MKVSSALLRVFTLLSLLAMVALQGLAAQSRGKIHVAYCTG